MTDYRVQQNNIRRIKKKDIMCCYVYLGLQNDKVEDSDSGWFNDV